MTQTSKNLKQAARTLRKAMAQLTFELPVTHVYQPLDYAWPMHEAYLERFGGSTKQVVMLGMNPGPWGMAQTGVPFGEVAAVRDWMQLDAPVGQPAEEHPKRPIEGLNCSRSEVSGRRLWGLFADRFGSAQAFFAQHFVTNYCPLVFMEEGGRNRTPDKLAPDEKAAIQQACDAHLVRVIEILKPTWVVGVGGFARQRAQKVLGDHPVQLATVLHPSPASPAANRGWADAATTQLIEQGVW